MSTAAPNWEDVHFDHAAAEAAVAALRAALAKLGAVEARRAAQAEAARQWWNGTYRDVFDAEQSAAARIAGGLQDALTTALRRIQRAGDAAVCEQHRRESERETYLRDRAEHERLMGDQQRQRMVDRNL